MTGSLTAGEAELLSLVDDHGCLSIDRSSEHLGTVRALARRGLVVYDRDAGVVRRVKR